jgi:methionine sulfoxide reductase heme-binding subunit
MTTWIILRAAGIGAYLSLFLSVAWGLIGTTALFGKKVPRATAVTIHQFLSTAAIVLLAVHLGGLLIDSFMPFGLLDVLLPFHTTFHPVAVTLGVLAMYAIIVVLMSSWFRKRVGAVLWRRLHLLAAPAFGLSMVHGIFAGTDAARPWMWGIYVATGLIVLFLVVVRGLTADFRPARHQVPAGARPRALPAGVGVPDREPSEPAEKVS